MITGPSHAPSPPCPLCNAGNTAEYFRDARRTYLHCSRCGLVFVPPEELLSEENEKKRYDLHRNGPDDIGYRRFLQRLLAAMMPHLAPGSSGLDFGSGPEPVLSRLFEEAGHRMTQYDRYYAADAGTLEKQYDFIIASEVIEHLRDPQAELDRLWSCLRPGARLGIMTLPLVPVEPFARWHYKNDLTHIRFYSAETFRWLASKWGAGLDVPLKDVIIFRKGDT